MGLYALTLVFACFALMTIHFLIGVAALVTIVFVMVDWVEGYTKGLTGSAEDSVITEQPA